MRNPSFLDRSRATLAALGLVALVPGCSIIPGSERLDVYVLPRSTATAANVTEALPWALRVATPLASGAVSGTRIAVMPQAQRISIYEGVRWSEATPELIRNRLLEAFRADGRVLQLSSDQAGLYADFELDGDLLAFQSEYRGTAVDVVVRFDARLIARNANRIVAVRRFEVREPATGVMVPEVVAAFGRAADALSAQIVEWTIEQGSTAYADDSPTTRP